GLLDRVADRVEHRNSFDLRAGLPRSHARHHVRAERAHLPGVDGALVARDPLDDHPSAFVDEDRHDLPRAASTAAWAEARRSETEVTPADRRISIPSFSLLPRILAISGNFSLGGTCRIASTSPVATVSQRVTPPKILRNTD